MPANFSGTYTNTVVLSVPTRQNPATVTATGTIAVSSTAASALGLYGQSGFAWTVTNLGTVESIGSSGVGIFLASGGSVTNGQAGSTAGFIEGNGTGVQISGAAGTVTNFGTILNTGTTGPAVLLGAGGTVRNSGTITATSGTSGTGVNLGSNSYLTNSSSGYIAGSGSGVGLFSSANGTIVNSGTIKGTAAGDPGGTGVNLGTSGTLTNFGTIQGAGENGFGVDFGNGGNLTNAGLISAYHIGVFASTATNPGTVFNLGTIQSTQTAMPIGFTGQGILLESGGAVTNGSAADATALISAADGNAISISGGAGTVTNFGTIRNSATNSSIYVGSGGTVVNGGIGNTTALIANSVGSGISIENAPGTVTNFGTIETTTTGTTGHAIYSASGGLISNYGVITGEHVPTVTGTVAGYTGVIEMDATRGTVRNFGTVATTNTGDGINLLFGGTVVNGTIGATTALISASVTGIYMGGKLSVPYPGATGTVVNYGTILVTGTGTDVHLKSGGTVTNDGLLTGAGTGISIGGAAGGSGTITNFGTVTSTTTGTSGQAIYLGAGGTVTNYGLISGSHIVFYNPLISVGAGINVHGQPGTVRNFGTIASTNDGDGVHLLDGGTLVNGSASATAATITAYRTGVYIGGTSGTPTPGAIGFVYNYGTIQNSNIAAQAVRLVSGGTVTNHGLISSARTGISFGDTAGTIVNFGAVVSTAPLAAAAGAGVYLGAGGQITNQAGATITAQRDAVSIGNTAATAAPALVMNSGVLTGAIGVAVGAADTGNNTVVNAGTITGTSGTAVYFGSGNNLLVIDPGAVFNGGVDGGSGNNTLELAAGSTTGTVGGGGNGTNFTTIEVDAGASWLLDVNDTLPPGVSLIDSGTLTYSGTVTNDGSIAVVGAGALIGRGSLINDGPITGSVTLAAGGYLDNQAAGTIIAPGRAVYGSGPAVTVVNAGLIASTGSNVSAIRFASSGSVVNTGTIEGLGASSNGIYLGPGGTVVNGQRGSAAGLITGNQLGVFTGPGGAPSTVVNYGTIQTTTTGTAGEAVELGSGGLVTNYGVITGDPAPPGGGRYPGVIDASNATATIRNFGTIATTNYSNGINLLRGGTLVNGAIGNATALIDSSRTAIYMGGSVGSPYPGAVGTVINYGTILSTPTAGATAGAGVALESGGLVVNGAGNATAALISSSHTGISFKTAAGTVVNFGTVVSTSANGTSGSGVYLGAGGTVTNGQIGSTAATITATNTAVDVVGGAGTITNFGTILSTPAAGGTSGTGVYLSGGGLVTNGASNATTALIYGSHTGVSFHDVAGTFVNYGIVVSASTNPTSGSGVYLGAGGAVVNAGTVVATNAAVKIGNTAATAAVVAVTNLATIEGNIGVAVGALDTAANTIVNAGTIDGFGGTAVSLGSGNDLLTIDPGAVFDGIVDGGGGTNTLELAAGSGTLTGLGTSFVDFAAVKVDPGAAWNVSDAAGSPPAFTNDGTIVVDNGNTLIFGPVGQDPGASGVIEIGGGGLAEFTGAVAAGQTVAFDGAGSVKIDDPGQFAAAITGFGQGDTIDLAGTSANRLVYADGVLNVLSGSTVVVSLSLPGNLAANQLALTGDGNGGSAITVTTQATSLFDFVYVYSDGKDYYYGTVADNGTYGYQVGQQVSTSDGQYTIYNQEAGTTSELPGTVFVTYYSHGGPGQASYAPTDVGTGTPDGSNGLGSEFDAILGTDGQLHPFTPTAEANFTVNQQFGFVFNYDDGSAYYAGTTSDNGSFNLAAIAASATPDIFVADGYYYVFAEGTTTLPAGSVVINDYTNAASGTSYAPAHMANGVTDGSAGLGSETGYFMVNGVLFEFTDAQEAVDPPVGPTSSGAPDPQDDADAVTQLYHDILGRAPDAAGLTAWTNALANGLTLAAVRTDFATSPEAQNDITLLYNQILGRTPAASEVAGWTGALANGLTLASVRTDFATSPEAQGDITLLYNQILGRTPAASEVAAWTGQLADGLTLASVRTDFATSAEAQGDITLLYNQVLGRTPAASEVAAWTSQLANGLTLASVRTDFATSAEAQGDLAQIFQNVEQRAPDAAELAGLEDYLAGGGTSLPTAQAVLVADGPFGFTTDAAPAGSATLTAAPGPEVFDFTAGTFGHDTINGFNVAQATIALAQAMAGDFATVQADTSASGGGALITFDPNHSILLSGVAPASLAVSNFHFG